ncbi:uncharacterized protein B0H18DRAFT_1160687 [Fomitopsis serialis]|uniref:uncharacterized protein n=1 Tax=Fomitopsis serialis TaxID=139415 RepID=UPI002007FB2F|nr:uncharacterized protein B0H18DRAFT_1160687 [Neoantrodia serialis]KAH9927668.1 hypothetical protein B0H18DRAFT_1160687 [Neoantrodia serialis]
MNNYGFVLTMVAILLLPLTSAAPKAAPVDEGASVPVWQDIVGPFPSPMYAIRMTDAAPAKMAPGVKIGVAWMTPLWTEAAFLSRVVVAIFNKIVACVRPILFCLALYLIRAVSLGPCHRCTCSILPAVIHVCKLAPLLKLDVRLRESTLPPALAADPLHLARLHHDRGGPHALDDGLKQFARISSATAAFPGSYGVHTGRHALLLVPSTGAYAVTADRIDVVASVPCPPLPRLRPRSAIDPARNGAGKRDPPRRFSSHYSRRRPRAFFPSPSFLDAPILIRARPPRSDLGVRRIPSLRVRTTSSPSSNPSAKFVPFIVTEGEALCTTSRQYLLYSLRVSLVIMGNAFCPASGSEMCCDAVVHCYAARLLRPPRRVRLSASLSSPPFNAPRSRPDAGLSMSVFRGTLYNSADNSLSVRRSTVTGCEGDRTHRQETVDPENMSAADATKSTAYLRMADGRYINFTHAAVHR